MRVLVAAVLLLAQPEAPSEPLRGIVLRHDGGVADRARVDLHCDDWHQSTIAEADGTFVFTGAPAMACTLVAHARDDSSAGVSVAVPVTRGERLSVILPAGVINGAPPASQRLQIDLSQDDAARSPAERTRLTGVSSWSSGLEPTSPGARPDQWSVGATLTRPGPWGTLLTASSSARRVSGPVALLSDATGTPGPGHGMWSALFDPSRALIWDVRLGFEKHWNVRGTDLTFFGDAFRSFEGGSGGNELGPLRDSATQGARTGAAGRFGLKVGF